MEGRSTVWLFNAIISKVTEGKIQGSKGVFRFMMWKLSETVSRLVATLIKTTEERIKVPSDVCSSFMLQKLNKTVTRSGATLMKTLPNIHEILFKYY